VRIVVENGMLIDGTGADPLERAGLVIDDGRIVAEHGQLIDQAGL
jgi:N-acyl-D-aspartate/D-glutamate deacylase